jgi:ParB family chromosome partitioning protein
MKTALGKGLGALIPEKKGREIAEVEIGRIASGREQPRKVFRDSSLKELAQSIKEKGILQPVLLRRERDGSFSLIAGERRVRAARLAGMKKVPAIIREAGPQDSLEIALVENIQREDLNPIDTAKALQRLLKSFGLTQEKLSGKVGMERATVANYIRLLKLPDEVKKLVNEGALSMGHARAILAVSGARAQVEAARKIVARGLSVREAEQLSKKRPEGKKEKPAARAARRDPHVADLEDKLKKSLGTMVSISHKGKKGKIEIEYYSLEELDRLLEILM